MKRDSKFRTFTGILAWIIAMGTVPPVVTGAEEIEPDYAYVEEITEPEISETEAAEPEVSETEIPEPEIPETEETESEETETEVSETEETEPEIPETEEPVPDEIPDEIPEETPETEPEIIEPEAPGTESYEPEVPETEAPETEEIFINENEPELPAEDAAVCELPEHIHADECYSIFCELEEHTHTDECGVESEIFAEEPAPEEPPEETPEEEILEVAVNVQDKMTEFADAVALFPDEADFISYDEENVIEIFEEEAYYKAYAAFYEENPDIWMTTDALFAETSDAFAAENPDGDFDAWMQDNGFWEVAEKFYQAVPTPETVAEITAQYEVVEEVELEFTAEQEGETLYGTGGSAAKDPGNDKPVVDNDGGIKFRLFNYSNEINKTNSNKNASTEWRSISSYFTFRGNNSTVGKSPSDAVDIPIIDDVASDGKDDNEIQDGYDDDGYPKTHATVERTLDSPNGYPVLELTKNADGTDRTDPNLSPEERSLKYLFDEKSTDHAVTPYIPINTILQRDGNHYYYNSSNNAVDYDIDSKEFRVRNYTERTKSTAGYSGYSDFLPFNYTNGVKLKDANQNELNYHLVPHNENTQDQYPEADYWFGMTMEIDFFMTKDGKIVSAGLDGELGTGDDKSQNMVFNFSGDDDVWVFIDDVLVLDLGGTHGTVDGSINFATGEVFQYLSWGGANSTDEAKKEGSNTSFPTTLKAQFEAAEKTPNGGWNEGGKIFADYTQHTLKFFYLERGGAVANCKLDFYLPTLPEKSLTVTKEVSSKDTNDATDFITDSLSYQFRVLKTDENGNATDELFIEAGTSYSILENGTVTGTGTVDSDGYFYLKAGQSAQFTDMLVKGDGSTGYVVEEILPDNVTGQYGSVEYEVSGDGGIIKEEEGPETSFTSYQSGELSAESTQFVTFKNKIDTEKLSEFSLTKKIADGSKINENTPFYFEVYLGGELQKGVTFYITNSFNGDTTRTTSDTGLLTLYPDEVATLAQGIISGTTYEVKEILDSVDQTTLVFYDASNGENVYEPTSSVHRTKETLDADHGITGSFAVDSDIVVTVTNSTYDVNDTYDLLVTKKITGNMGDINRIFSFEAVISKYEPEEQIGYEEAPVLLMSSADDIPAGDIGSVTEKLEFTLGHNDSYKIVGIPEGYTVTISELDAEGYDTTIVWDEITETYNEDADIRSLTTGRITESGGEVLFTNDKTAIIDTAVTLDYLPYIILFSIVGTGIILTSADKRRRTDEE